MDPTSINGLNLYSYCGNDSVMLRSSCSYDYDTAVSPLSLDYGSSTKYQYVQSVSTSSNGNLNIFGLERRESAGWNTTPSIATSWFGRVGFSFYDTIVHGDSNFLYAFYGSTLDILNSFGITHYAGVGINVFDVVKAEIQFETVGIGIQVGIGNFVVGASVNLIGATSITVGINKHINDNIIRTKGFTVGINTGALVAIFAWAYKLVTTGDPTPIPRLLPN